MSQISLKYIPIHIYNFENYESAKRTCLYRPNAWWGGEFEWPKTLQGPQLENFRERLGFGVIKPLKNLSNCPYITTCCLGGFQEKLSWLIPKKKTSNIFSCQTRLELQMGLASMVIWNKKLLFSRKHSRWVWWTQG